MFGGETPSNNAFGNRLDRQCELLEEHLANDPIAAYLKITPGTSALSAALKQSDAVKHNKDLEKICQTWDYLMKCMLKLARSEIIIQRLLLMKPILDLGS